MTMDNQTNPYQVPAANVLKNVGEFSDLPRSVSAGQGVQWIAEGWRLFRLSPGLMILMPLIYMLINGLLGVIPLLGIVSPILSMILLGGMIIAIRNLDQTGTLRLEDIFTAFQTHLLPLILLGLLLLGGITVVILVVGVLGFGAILGSSGEPSTGSILFIVFLVLASLAFFLILYFTVMYGVLLVVLGNQPLGAALSHAFSAFMKNVLPFLVNGLLALGLTLLALVPAGLGLLILGPVMLGSMYASYKDIFAAE